MPSTPHVVFVKDHAIPSRSLFIRLYCTVLPFLLESRNATKATLCSLGIGGCPPGIGQFRDALREIDVDPVIVDQDPFHLGVGVFTILLIFKFNERVLKTLTRLLVSNHLAGKDLSKTTEDCV